MRRPRIGIPLTLDDRGRWRRGRRYHYIDRSYADAVARAGGLPLQLPIQADAVELVSLLDGLLLPGGDDFIPAALEPALGWLPGAGPGTSTETPAAAGALDPIAAEQLLFDRALVSAARDRGLPILGICYGMQLLGLLSGGALHFHLPTDCPEAEPHGGADPEIRHAVRIDPTSRLAAALGREHGFVNSLHHQALRSVGSLHRVVARSPDGMIEAIESRRPGDGSGMGEAPAARPMGWELGVQWHPEKLEGAESDRLFRYFVEACEAPCLR